ncbi:hypothetical protein P7K49_029680 [Saguinus oedipus]|uniref:Uncharacterized protein n=1 Tax=Saguinus oedipus TaxID=9490 RepID=A0ABQ9U7Y8_SAGOE|nr:hypothetical protein P7K49_029680 [Saguinus oedipus]
MKRISGSRDQKGQGPSDFFTCWWRSSRGDVAERDDSTFAQRGYNIRGKHLGKLHGAASRDDVFRVQLILLRGNVDLDERKRQEEELTLAVYCKGSGVAVEIFTLNTSENCSTVTVPRIIPLPRAQVSSLQDGSA